MKARYVLALAMATLSSQALMAAPAKIPALPAFGAYDEKPSDDALQVCNTNISAGPAQTHFGTTIPTFNLEINDLDGGFNAICVPRITVGVDKSGNEFVKSVANKALCSESVEGELQGVAEVIFSATSVTYGGAFIEVVDGVATGLTESFKSTFKKNKGNCPL